MAAVSPPQALPTQPTASPPRRKPVPSSLQSLPSERGSVDENDSSKPLPTVPVTESAPYRPASISPVSASEATGALPSPSNTSVEIAPPVRETQAVQIQHPDNRALPKSPEAPPPPPHSPPVAMSRDSGPTQGGPGPHISVEKPLPPVHSTSSPTVQRKQVPRKALPKAGSAPGPPHPAARTEPDYVGDTPSPSGDSRFLDPQRQSRESDATSNTTQPQTATNSSGATSASSVSNGANEATECPDDSVSVSPESSVMEGSLPRNQSVPQFQYHHNPIYPKRVSSVLSGIDPRAVSNPDLLEMAGSINRHLTPGQQAMRRSSLPRPNSAYSIYSDYGPRGRSPGNSHVRAPSSQSRRSPDIRPTSYAELLNVPYPQPPPAAMTFDNSHLKSAVGNNAALLSTQKTLDMYRQNVKKTNDFSIQYSFAVFLITTAQEMGITSEGPELRKASPKPSKSRDSPAPQGGEADMSPHGLVREARTILTRLAGAGYPFAQYYLADGYASGLFGKGKEDYSAAFPLFVSAAKHGHAESAYRAGLCYEFGWGTRKDPARAAQFFRVAATKSHPGGMTRLGQAYISGDLGEKKYREGLKWLTLGAEAADTINNAAPYHLGCMYEIGYGDHVFKDQSYAAELFTQAAELGHAEANYRMGDSYEHGKLNCPRDPALSVHFYTCAAEKGHPAAMMGLCAWYMVGAEPILEKDEEEAYEWARRSAELGEYFPSGVD